MDCGISSASVKCACLNYVTKFTFSKTHYDKKCNLKGQYVSICLFE